MHTYTKIIGEKILQPKLGQLFLDSAWSYHMQT